MTMGKLIVPKGWWRRFWQSTTLIEVMIGITIIGIMCAIGYNGFFAKSDFMEECRQIKSEAECSLLWRLKR